MGFGGAANTVMARHVDPLTGLSEVNFLPDCLIIRTLRKVCFKIQVVLSGTCIALKDGSDFSHDRDEAE